MKRAIGVVAIVCCLSLQSFAQFVDDALRFSTPGLGVGARAMGMGGAYTGVASDYSALFWNPAGLTQLQYGEFSFGLSHTGYLDASTFLSNTQSLGSNAIKLNSLGIAYPVPVRRGSLVLAFGYHRQSDFTTGVSFKGFNPNGSIVQAWAPNGQPYPSDVTLAEDLKLAVADTATRRFYSPITGRLTQLGKATEEGGLNNWSAGGALEFSQNMSLGITLTYVSGTYKYARNYSEQDNNGVYTRFPFDFDELVVDDEVQSDLSGYTAKFGLMYKQLDRFRVGITIKTPTSFAIKETFNTTATSYFDSADVNGVSSYGPFDSPGSNEYDVLTPWVFSAGASVMIRDLVLSGDIEYTDWTTMEFRNANKDLLAKNKDIKNVFRETFNLRGGAEYDIKDIGLRVRGGFMYNTSPYKDDAGKPEFNQKYVTAGFGVLLGESTMLDVGYAHGWWKTFRVSYLGGPRVDEKINANNFVATLSFRF